MKTWLLSFITLALSTLALAGLQSILPADSLQAVMPVVVVLFVQFNRMLTSK